MRMLFSVIVILAAVNLPSNAEPLMDVKNFEEVAAHHPAGEALARLFPTPPATAPADFKSTGLTKADYLKLTGSVVDFWKNHQNDAGAIIDPYENKERQYSTPAFALAGAELVKEANRDDLLEPSVRAFSFALTALVNKTTADGHADFYIPMLMHAHRILKTRVSADQAKQWEDQLKSLVPERTYRAINPDGNWNLVNVSGEALRRKDGLVAATQATTQSAYIDSRLKGQQKHFSKFGMYEDPNVPLAYDAFPRLWLEDMNFEKAYTGPEQPKLEEFLTLGGLSTLLLLSPSGEWACGGRSAHHQWNEAEVALICEINAQRWKQRGRDDIAGAFKRCAHLALSSMNRWVRPSGELWIVKNHAEPQQRFGYEGYSFHSQYNLLPMGMLSMAYERADDSIAERAAPAETGSYVFDLREKFHKICAAAGGYYVLIDTSADPHYNATGLQRVHRSGAALSPLTDSSAGERGIGPSSDKNKRAITPGIEWKQGSGDWRSLAQFSIPRQESPPRKRPDAKSPAPPPTRQDTIEKVDLKVTQQTSEEVAFTVLYTPAGEGALPVEEQYAISAAGIKGVWTLATDRTPATRAVFPVLVNDGANDLDVNVQGSQLSVKRPGGAMTWKITSPNDLNLKLEGPRYVTHNGYVQPAIADLPHGTAQVRWELTLEPSGD